MNLYRIAGLVACVSAVALRGNALDPVQWSMTSTAEVAKAGATVPLHLTAKIEPGWHLYSLTIPKNLLPTKITLDGQPRPRFLHGVPAGGGSGDGPELQGSG